MIKKIKRLLIGRPLSNEELHWEKFNVLWGLPILSSDAISSVAYAGEEILWVLIPIIGLMAYKYMFYVALSIVALMLILVLSYRQTIDSYPNGGGSYIVAKDNLGTIPGLVAASALLIDYILTVSVSASAGTAAVTSAMPSLLPFKVEVTLVFIFLITLGNLRGIRESSRMFGIPTYLFMLSMLAMIIIGLFKVYILGYVPTAIYSVPQAAGEVTIFLLLRAFASGCTALTGIEAVSNGIPNFAEPSQKRAKTVLALLAVLVLFIFGGTSFLARIYHAVPNYEVTVIAQIASQVFGTGVMYYVIQVTTAVILIMAANTSFSGLPLLLSLIARDGFAPRQFARRGSRLSYSNGIIVLSIMASLLVIVFRGESHLLLPLYAIGVFISFTLSQTGMSVKWLRHRDDGWVHKAFINGVGALITFITVIIIAYTKIHHGAWIVMILIPVFVMLMLRTKAHYDDVARQLKLTPDDIEEETELVDVKKHVIVLVDTLNRASLKAISYARFITDEENVIAFHVSNSPEESKKLREKWKCSKLDIPLVIKYSSTKEVVKPLADYIESKEHPSNPGDMITVVMPQFVVRHWWENIFHNKTADSIQEKLLQDRHIAVISVPYVLD